MKTPRNMSLGMLSPSGPPPFPRMNGIMLRSLRHCSDSKEMPPVKVRCNASRRSSTRGKGLPRATRPRNYDGITSELAATTRRRALTMREVTSTSAIACLRRAIVVSQMGWRSSSTAIGVLPSLAMTNGLAPAWRRRWTMVVVDASPLPRRQA